ncbi:kinase-like domain-containing protein [Chytriomyces sp. MP71]|nr:kinase-like domain-containing protein [Chytriomyces sp. MP71]
MQLNQTRVTEYLASQFAKANTDVGFQAPIEIRQFKFGQSNPTYFVRDANGNRFVLRKKPPGSLLSKTAHAVEREYRVISALGKHSNVPVPRAYFLCEDTAVVGTPFYLMEFLQGRIFGDNALPELQTLADRANYDALMDTLAKLHSANVAQLGLSDYSRNPTGFYSRQIATLTAVTKQQYASNPEKVPAIPRLDDMLAWFKRNMVPDEPATIVHGDFKLDNVIYHPTEPRIIGILDWELSTLGHPLSDLANCLLPWYTPTAFDGTLPGAHGFKDADRPLHVPEVTVLIKEYCKRAERKYPIEKFEFCIAFSFFRALVIVQGVQARAARKQASSGNAIQIDDSMMRVVAQLVLNYVDNGDLVSSKL